MTCTTGQTNWILGVFIQKHTLRPICESHLGNAEYFLMRCAC